jgi:hypothetical protein
MPRRTLDFSRRALLSELMDEPCSREDLRAYLPDLATVNGLTLGCRPPLDWLGENELSHIAIPYHRFRAFAKLANFHRFVQQDAPTSIARSFLAEDWRRMCAAAGLNEGDVSIGAHRPATLCVARSKIE